MTLPSAPADRTLQIYLSLAQYPILSAQIRSRMRRELFNRGIISSQTFEAEAREKAIQSQALEGLHDPFSEEPVDIWELRISRVRDHLTDFYFAYNLPFELFEQVVRETLSETGAGGHDMKVTFNPELAPQTMLFEQAMTIERLPPEKRIEFEARLQEIKVVLIRTLISDQLAYVKIAKDWFTISDLNEIRTHKIGQGKIGGKAAGMLLAARILVERGDEEIRLCLRLPESYFLGADLTYTFMSMNGLMHWGDQKYKTEEEIRADHPVLLRDFLAGELPEDILDKLRSMLENVGNQPLIVRSSSLLEDNFGTSFAGKYESHFCPNQGTSKENLKDLSEAIIRIYASVFTADALLYRRTKGLQDYDERMAILIQVVQGNQFENYFFPQAAGVAFSRNMYRWSPQIRKEDGFMRLVWGLGTRAVDRVGNDYPRLVALSHPNLHPEASAKSIRRYSQQYIDLIDLEENVFKTMPVKEILSPFYPVLRYMVQVDQGGYLTPLRMVLRENSNANLVLTFDELLRRTPFAKRISRMLQILEDTYGSPVDTEFAAEIINPSSAQPDVEISLLQCRPQSHFIENSVRLPKNLDEKEIIFSTSRMAPQGRISDIRYVIYVSPKDYFALPTPSARAELGRSIGLLNSVLKEETFICIGPGRWGTSNPDLGVRIGYADIYHTRALVELTGEGIGEAPEASFGTHFFQDLVESNIYPLAIYLDEKDMIFNDNFFDKTINRLTNFLPDHHSIEKCLRLLDIQDYCKGYHMELVMDDEAGKSVAFLEIDQ
jgi:hypothetical protein